MSINPSTAISVSAVEALLLHQFETEPFHNLRLIYGEAIARGALGGTCSDKTLSFICAAKQAGITATLHSGFINGQDIHRLARVNVAGRTYFADVGNGWPALKLYPADCEVAFRCFGMGFRTEISGDHLHVFHERKGREYLQLTIPIKGKPESEIQADIKRRFDSGIVYPFREGLRFSLVVGEHFMFLRDNGLEIYSDHSFQEKVVDIQPENAASVIAHYFSHSIGPMHRS